MSARIPWLLAMAPLLIVPAGCGDAQPAGAAPLALERTIALANVSGRIDHLAVDIAHRRIFVAELGNGSVDEVDIDSGRTRRIGGLHEPQGIAYLPGRGELAVASGGDGTIRFYDAGTLRATAVLRLGADADNMRVDPRSGEIVVGYGSGAVAFIDPARRTVVRTIRYPAHPESFQIDPGRGRLFVNLPGAHAIAVSDPSSGSAVAQWRAAYRSNFPMALDEKAGALAVAYRSPARLAILDASTGATRREQAICGDADDLFFDHRRQRLYVICGSGEVEIFPSAAAVSLARVATRSGARTGLFVPELDRLLVAAPAGLLGASAALLVFRPLP